MDKNADDWKPIDNRWEWKPHKEERETCRECGSRNVRVVGNWMNVAAAWLTGGVLLLVGIVAFYLEHQAVWFSLFMGLFGVSAIWSGVVFRWRRVHAYKCRHCAYGWTERLRWDGYRAPFLVQAFRDLKSFIKKKIGIETEGR